MNDPMMNEGTWPTWLPQALWLEWLQLLLYCLLAIAVVSLVLALLDLALLCWKEFHNASTETRAKAEPRRKAENAAVTQAKSMPLIRALFLLACCWQVSPVVLAQEPSPALTTAIRNGDLKQVKSLLAKGANINAPDAGGTTPLMYAVVNAEADCVKLLLDHGADPNLSNKAGATALMWAVSDLKKVQFLLAKGANVNAVSKDEKSPLLMALRLPDAMPVVQALLTKEANVNQADKDGFTPLMRAGFSGKLEIVQLLLANGADPQAKSKNGMTYLKALVSSANLPSVRWALAQGADVKDPKDEFLLVAAMTGDLAVTRMLLDQGATPVTADDDGFTSLMVAVITEDSSLEMVKLLLAKGADVKAKTKSGLTALTFAKRKGWTEAIALLTKAGATE